MLEHTENIRKLKSWIVLREDLKYSSYRLIKNLPVIFAKEFNNKEKWIENGFIVKYYMIFSLSFLDKIEKFLIEDGFYFDWIYDNKIPIGIFIHPTYSNLRESILSDCLDFESYAKYQKSLNELNKS